MTSKDKPPRGAASGRPTGARSSGSKASRSDAPKGGAGRGAFGAAKPGASKSASSKPSSGKPGGSKFGAKAGFAGAAEREGRPEGRSRDDKPGFAKAAKPFSGARSEKPFAGERGARPSGAGRGERSFDRDETRAERPRFDKSGGDRPARARKAETVGTTDDAPQRISKILARAGVASRRDIERMIMEGRVALNGVVLDTPVVNVTLSDRIEVDGQPIRGIERTRLWLYHKPAGLVTTNSDPEGRPTVFDRLPEELPRVLSIGRLDINTEGLLLLTNDGGLARVLELPSTGWLRRYRVRAHGTIEQAELDKLKDGIAVEGVLYGSIEATLDKVQGSNVWITMGLREGKNREIKNVLGALGLEVNRLIRLSYGPFQLGDIPEGAVQEIRGRMLRDQLGPRLIEEAKANFEAPLFNDAPAVTEEKDEASSPRASAPRERGGFREDEGDRRERLRARLDTRPDGGRGGRDAKDAGRGGRDAKDAGRGGRDNKFGGRDGKAGGRDEDRFEARPKRQPAQRQRTANVWMAPGARPVAEKRAEGETAETPIRRDRADGVPRAKRYGRTAEGQLTKGARKFDPDRKADDRGAPKRAPRAARLVDSEGEWISASTPPAREDGGNGRGGRDGGFAKAGRSGDRATGGRFGDREDRPAGREGGKRSFSDRPARSDAAFGDRPAGKGFGDRAKAPRGSTSFGDKPAGGKSFGGKSFGGKSGDGKSFGGRPSGSKPSGAKPFGGRPSGGGKPRGRGN
ncbi:pseudouridine synthase [Rhizobium sp. YIM 134829]|uniref:pseudouridine synthase n=1 Tax=Rhizobium sp. YIM 134829 TaxID=3390453 RepID=UPI00397D70D4